MIYKTDSENFHLFESYKERNFYYKIFAGYLFNELLPGYEQRKRLFLNLLKSIVEDNNRFFSLKNDVNLFLEKMASEEWNVTFDYHLAQIFKEDKADDRGEMSDVLILGKSCFISIECKLLSNYNIGKDIITVQKRIKKFANHFQQAPFQILLIKRQKWENSARIKDRSELTTSGHQFDIPLLVLFWDELETVIDSPSVKAYLLKQDKRKGDSYIK